MSSKALAVAWALSVTFLAAAGEGDWSKPLARIGERLGVPSARVPRLAVAPDQAPDLSKWAGPLDLRYLDGAAGPPPLRTKGYLACDADHLYAAIACDEPEMDSVAASPVPLDGNVWAGDSVELLVLPGLDPAGIYAHFAMSTAGSLYDARANDKSWNSGATVRITRGSKGWTAVLSVPFRALGVEGDGPALWRVNLHRLRPRSGGIGEMDVAWSPTRSRSNHVPARFGLALLEGRPFDPEAAMAWLDAAEKLQVLLRQTFETGIAPFDKGRIVRPEGAKPFLRAGGERLITLERNFGDIRGLRMACAYRTSPGQVGLVIHGNGTVVRACRPGKVEVLGRGLKVAQQTCQDADHQSRAFDLGLDAFRFVRPYGHCQQSNMPPTPGGEWAVAQFEIDDMYSNDTHTRANDPRQQYERFYFTLNGDLTPASFIELAWVVVWRGKDDQPPTTPAAFAAPRQGGKVAFSWSPAADNLMVHHYEILRKAGDQWQPLTISTMDRLELPAAQCPAGDYAVRAIDVAGNASGPSSAVALAAD